MELKTINLTKQFGNFTAVDHLNLSMTGGVYGLLGINGAGKTTLMRMLCTLLSPTGGTISFNGEDIFRMGADYRKILGYLPQDFGFYPEFTVKEYLLYIASLKGIRPAVAKKRVKDLIDGVGLAKNADKKMKKLSGGMKRRAGIAQAMLNDPKILILDEPTAGLDPVGVEEILGNIRDYHQAKNATIIIVSHSMEEMARTVDRIVVVNDGRIPFSGAPREVFAHGDELEAMGLGVPAMTRVFHRLRAMGVDIDASVYTTEQARDAILARLGRGQTEKGAV